MKEMVRRRMRAQMLSMECWRNAQDSKPNDGESC